VRTAWLLLIALVLSIVLVGCLALTPEQGEKLESMNNRMIIIQKESKSTAEQIERLWQKQAEVREKLKNGELTPEEAAALIVDLSAELKEAVAHFNSLKAEGQALYAEYKDLKDSGVPWYVIAGNVLLGAVTIWLGKEKLTLGTAVTGLVRALEFGRDKKDMKRKAAALNNPAVERAVLKLPSIPRDPLPSEIPPREEPVKT